MSAKNHPPTVQISADEMERNWRAYLRRVEAGETLVIVKAGKPVAEVKPHLPLPVSLRPYGLCAGEFTVPEDFDAPLPAEIIQEFEGL